MALMAPVSVNEFQNCFGNTLLLLATNASAETGNSVLAVETKGSV